MIKKNEEITLEEFDKKYMNGQRDWNFNLFKIVCVKCNSNNVEFNGQMETEYGYYGSFDVTSMLVVKCHDCGNAFGMKHTQGGSNDYCTLEHKDE